METIEDDAILGLLNTEMTAAYGDCPMIVVTGLNYPQLIPYAINEDYVKAAFNLEDESYGQEDCDSDLKLPGDINKDCRVDFQDLAILASNWMVDISGSDMIDPDMNNDNMVDIMDLRLLTQSWLLPASTYNDLFQPPQVDDVLNLKDFSVLSRHWNVDMSNEND
jgi:hypothetical protein